MMVRGLLRGFCEVYWGFGVKDISVMIDDFELNN